MIASYDGLRFRKIPVNGVGIHVQEAGDPDGPHLLLLHGFPSTSRMWDRLIPTLAARYHVIAPDYPGFGLSEAPPPGKFDYTFDNIAATMAALLRQMKIARYSLVMQDYGGPIGFRMAIADPAAIELIVAQNNAAYDEALGPTWDARKAFWKDPAAIARFSRRISCRSKLLGAAMSEPRPISSYTTRTHGTTSSPC